MRRRRLLWLVGMIALVMAVGVESEQAQTPYVTLIGTLQGSNGTPASNYAINFKPTQIFFIAGSGVVVPASTSCATSVDGSVVGVQNPLVSSIVSPVFSGTLPIGNYYVVISFYNASGQTLVGPETAQQLVSAGSLTIAPPISGVPSTATGMNVYIGTSSGTETLQGSTTGSASFVQSTPLASGAALPSANTTVCKQVANDAGWPTGTGYNVSLTDTSGNVLPGYPMEWQLMGAGTTVNLSNGLPYYHGTVYYPSPLLASPLNHATQSISGPLNMTTYNIFNLTRLGVGTSQPAWPIDVENGPGNFSGGVIYNGGAAVNPGNCLLADTDSFRTFRVPAGCLTNAAAQHVVTGSRAIGTCYTNSTGLPINVYVTVTAPGTDSGTALANVGAGCGSLTNVGAATEVASGASPVSGMVSFQVPVGWAYSVTRDAVLTLSTWVENY